MRPAAFLLVLVWAFAPVVPAQISTPAEPLRFEVATIKPVDMTPGASHTFGIKVYPGGRLVAMTFTLKDLICAAFDVSSWQLRGGDAWIEKQRYDVEGKAPEAVPPTSYELRYSNFSIADGHLREMLQALLIERFQLRFHRDSATGQVMLLERSGKPVSLEPSKQSGGKMYGEGYSGDVGFVGNRWGMYNTSMPQFARYASGFLQKTVVDRTGLEGAYDFRWVVEDADPKGGPDFMDVYRSTFPLFVEAAGLKLTKATGPVETFVIDHAEPPTGN